MYLCRDPSETLIHLFWSGNETSSFWYNLIEWLRKVCLIPEDFSRTNITVLGMRSDTSNKLLFPFSTMLYMGCQNKTKFTLSFAILVFLKSKYDTGLNCGDSEKWEPLVDYLAIISRRRGEYCRIIPETKSRRLFDNIHRA